MYDAILLPTDGSDGTEAALAHALTLAADYDATLHALYVVDKRLYLAADDEEREEILERLEGAADEALSSVAERASEAGVATVTERRHGVSYRDILAYADEAAVDLVVMGSHGRTGRERLTSLGSTSERVVKSSERPVLTVRLDGD
jgi:nucleotide-binding universal stress UspA family protein